MSLRTELSCSMKILGSVLKSTIRPRMIDIRLFSKCHFSSSFSNCNHAYEIMLIHSLSLFLSLFLSLPFLLICFPLSHLCFTPLYSSAWTGLIFGSVVLILAAHGAKSCHYVTERRRLEKNLRRKETLVLAITF